MNFKSELMSNILPFWLENSIDNDNGGIFTCLTEDGKIYGEEKSVWFQGRGLWVFSKAYNLIEHDPAYLNAAKAIYEFIPKCEDIDGRLFFTVTKEGKGIQKRRYFFSETFAAIGCAEYYKATKEEKALFYAEKYFNIAYDCFKGKIKLQPKYNQETVNLKSLSPVMIMLSTAQVLRSIDGLYEKYDKIAKECLDEILHGGYLTEKALLEHVSKDGNVVNTPTGRIVNPGHSLEAAWFIMSEGLLTDNKEAIDSARKIIDVTLPLGIDKINGGIIAFTDVMGKPPIQLEWDMKLWWPQCEAMIALRLAHIVFKEEKYKTIYNEIKDYCKKYFCDEKNGEWYGYLHYDNTVSTTLKGNIFKGPFHIPRLYMIMSVIDEMNDIEPFLN